MNRLYWQQLITSRRPDLGAVLLFTAVFILFFAPVLFTGRVFVTNDAFVYTYPLRSVAWEQIRHGQLPFWLPQLMSGYPLLSMAQLGIGYPLTWTYLFLPGYIAEEIYVMAPFLLGPIFMYAWIRELDRSRLASLFAAFAFGYGGMMFSPIAHNGMLTNTMMWTPLILIAIERARSRSFFHCLFWASLAYSLSTLTGIGQGIIQVTTIVLGYGLFLSALGAQASLPARRWHYSSVEPAGKDACAPGLAGKDACAPRLAVRWSAWSRWRPLAVAVGATALGLGVSAFQILETMQAQRLSIRSELPYEIFSEGAFAPLIGVKSLLAPLYYQTDVTAYIVPVALLVAVWALIKLFVGPQRDWRILFWAAVAVWAWIWMLGPNTSVYPFLYRVPFLNKFRVPSRHAFEWTFAAATMAAYGWDAVASRLSKTKPSDAPLSETVKFVIGLMTIAAALVVAWLWWQSTLKVTVPVHSNPQILTRFLEWKLLFTVLLLLSMFLGWRLMSNGRRAVLLVAAMTIACLVEPATAASYWWWPKSKNPDRFSADAIATRFLKEKNINGDRVYTFSSIWAEEYLTPPRIDPPNFSALRGIRDVGGYEPLFYERYSRALGNVTIDAVYPRPGNVFDGAKFDARSHVLDLLNTRFVVSYSDLSTLPDGLEERDGVKFFRTDSYFVVKPGETKVLSGASVQADSLGLVAALANATDEPQEAPIAKISFTATDGQVLERRLRAGVDASEWAIDSPGAIDHVQHKKAKVYDSYPVDGGRYEGHRFWSLIRFAKPVRLDRIEISNVSGQSEVLIWKASLYDSTSKRSIPLPHYDESKWRPVYDANNVLVLENDRALPRAWLVGEVESADAEQSLRRIRGEDERPFDPKRTALLEVTSADMPQLPPGMISTSAEAQIIGSRPGYMNVYTKSESASVLIVSEVNYPGWTASVDGRPAPLHIADYLLMGVPLTAGDHRVELRYEAPAARRGGIISACSLLVIVGVGIYSRRRRTSQS
ncbi:MAG TPA: YfhO family protein [Pyrinomonadaceae bacterium]|nr:YfhO family protein [Pyrinomonadaceae bacterium]